MQGGQFWIADNRLTKFDVQAARGRLMPKWIVDDDTVAYLQPPVAFGQAVVSVRRKAGMPGAIVAAVTMQEPEKYWETQLASPPAGEPIVLGKSKNGQSNGDPIKAIPIKSSPSAPTAGCSESPPTAAGRRSSTKPWPRPTPSACGNPSSTSFLLPAAVWPSAAAEAAIRSACSIPRSRRR